MDSLQVEALRFGTAFLAGGLVAVASAVVTYRYAQRLQRERDERRAADLRRALVAEIRENIHRLGDQHRGWAIPAVPLVRTAWDQARILPLPKAAFDAIAAGYEAGTYANEVTTLALASINRPWTFFEKLRVPGMAKDIIAKAQSQSRVARDCFIVALRELGTSPD
jgi:hypothetical protein